MKIVIMNFISMGPKKPGETKKSSADTGCGLMEKLFHIHIYMHSENCVHNFRVSN